MIPITDYMTKKVMTIDEDKTVFEAVQKMDEKEIGSLVVVKNNKLTGIITERDILKKIVAKGANPKWVLVKEVMTTKPKTVEINTTVLEATKIMKHFHFRRLIVLEKNKVIGIVTAYDLMDLIAGE